MTDQAASNYSAEIEEIWALFAQEGTESLDTVEAALLTLESNPTDAERISELFRALHTFKGMVRMMGLPTIEALSHCAEDLVGLVRDDGVPLTGEMIDALLGVLDEIRAMLTHALAHRQDATDFQVTPTMVRLKLLLARYSEEKSSPAANKPLDPPHETAPAANDNLLFFEPQPAAPAVSEPEPPPAAESILLPGADLIDPATDPVYRQIFHDIVEEELWRLHQAQAAIAAGDESGYAQIKDLAGNLCHAARQMGYAQIIPISDQMVDAVENLAGNARSARLAETAIDLENLLVELLGEDSLLPAAAPDSPPAATPAVSASPASAPVPTFLSIAQNELNHLHGALIALLGGDGHAVAEIEQVVSALKAAALPLGYNRLATVADNLLNAATEPTPDAKTRETRLCAIELALFEELTAIQEISQTSVPVGGADMPGFVWLFRRWHAVRVFANLARLREVTDDMEQFVHRFLAGGNGLDQVTQLTEEAAYLLRTVYHSCLFYKLDQVARLTLALEDLYARVAQQEMTANEALIKLTQTYVTQLGHTIEAIREGEEPELAQFEAMIGQAQEVLYRHADGQPLQIVKEILNLLDLSPEFKTAMTPDNMLAVGQAMQAGQQFYTVLADLNSDEAIGLAFYEWSQTSAVTLITNVTVYQHDQSLFNFLLATHATQESILEAFAKINPQGDKLTLKACALRADVNPEAVIQTEARQEQTLWSQRESTAPRAAADANALAGLTETIGTMLSAHATLRRITDRLAGQDLAKQITQVIKQAGGNWDYARHEIQRPLELLTNELHAMAQAEAELGANLNQLYEMALTLRVQPAAQILDPLTHFVEDLAHHHGKPVKLTISGAEVGLDQDILDILANPVRRLVWLAVTHSLEPPETRRAEGKPPEGQITITLKKYDNQVQLAVEDDGGGLGQLDLVHPEYSGEASHHSQGTELAAINAELQARRGQLVINQNSAEGLRCAIHLPLAMVVVDGVVARVGQIHYIVPVGAVNRIVKPEQTDIIHTSADGKQNLLRLGEQLIPIQSLPGSTTVNDDGQLLLVVEKDTHVTALKVDELLGQQQVLIRPVQGYLAKIRDVSGCALLGDGDVGMVLNLNQMGWLE